MGVPLSRGACRTFLSIPKHVDDSEGDLTKLMQQLARRVPELEIDDDVVKVPRAAFKSAETATPGKLATTTRVRRRRKRSRRIVR